MKKIISVFLILFFSFSAFEIYAIPTASKSCCCPSAKVCKCKHAGGACPLALREEAERYPGNTFIKLAGCGAGNSPVVSPQFHKEIYLEVRPEILFRLPTDKLVVLSFNNYNFLPLVSIDQPPKNSLLF